VNVLVIASLDATDHDVTFLFNSAYRSIYIYKMLL